MSKREADKIVNTHQLVRFEAPTQEPLYVECLILRSKFAFGCTRYEVTPINGRGVHVVDASRIEVQI